MLNTHEKGTLSVVATPIGNLEDISARAIRILQETDLIVAEDTKHSLKLLNYLTIKKTLISYHDHSTPKTAQYIIDLLISGKNIALISDAGTPLIADPGYRLVKKAHELGIRVQPLPGACAAISALCVSGLPTDRFLFLGFLATKSITRNKILENMANFSYTWIFYESPIRIISTLQNMQAILSANRMIVIAKELTKRYETIIHGTIIEVINNLQQKSNYLKGEYVVLVKGYDKNNEISVNNESKKILRTLLTELPLKKASRLTAKITGCNKRDLYKFGLTINKNAFSSTP